MLISTGHRTPLPKKGTGSAQTHSADQLEVDFDDPNDYWYNQIVADVIVTHNGSNTTYNIYTGIGSAGAASYCASHYTGFTAVNGDTITIRITGARVSSNAIVKFRNVRIYRNA